jgi:hypothetical protein
MTKETSSKRLPKLTDAERHKRFVEMAREVDASEKPEDFDRAFDKLTKNSNPNPQKRKP